MKTINKALLLIGITGIIAMCTMRVREAVMAFPMIVSLMLCLAMIFDDTAWDNEDA